MSPNFAARADYMRLEVVRLQGGIYLDTDTEQWPVVNLSAVGRSARSGLLSEQAQESASESPPREVDGSRGASGETPAGTRNATGFGAAPALFRWPFVSHIFQHYNDLSNGVFGFEKNSSFLLYAIRAARAQCLGRWKTCGVLAGAGPHFLTAAAASWKDPEMLLIEHRHVLDIFGQCSSGELCFSRQTLTKSWCGVGKSVRDEGVSEKKIDCRVVFDPGKGDNGTSCGG